MNQEAEFMINWRQAMLTRQVYREHPASARSDKTTCSEQLVFKVSYSLDLQKWNAPSIQTNYVEWDIKGEN
jgi:hypothetical protein